MPWLREYEKWTSITIEVLLTYPNLWCGMVQYYHRAENESIAEHTQ